MKMIKSETNETIKVPSQFADLLGTAYAGKASKAHKKGKGQFFTPPEIATFMGQLATLPISKNISILDPGCGTAILACTLIETLSNYTITSITLVAFETDRKLLGHTQKSLQNLKKWLSKKGIRFSYTLFANDFIKEMAAALAVHKEKFDYIISNPPYFKLPKTDKRIALFQHLVKGQPNIYSFFMAVSVHLLKKNGELIFLVPRSFASGQYFNSFRDYFFQHIHLNYVHLFKSRSKTFDRDSVLQETLILKASKQASQKVTVSTSEGLKDIYVSKKKEFDRVELIDLNSKAKILHLPTTLFEEEVMKLFATWNNHLIDFGIQISTGPVVSFRAKAFLFETYINSSVFLTPLYWLHNVTKMEVTHPNYVSNKHQFINMTNDSKRILLPNKNYVLLRRFSSKDDKSRLIAAPYFAHFNESQFIGVENKLNYIYRLKGELTDSEAVGIAALLNTTIFDTYFRTFNGNVNVSATEIRLMPFPDIEKIVTIGKLLIEQNDFSEAHINQVVNQFLRHFKTKHEQN